ncbi:MAG TPA: methylated-DNA--[protein]-cysteine S-methyltransferase [Clostridia bacterium]|nr:methylated-DNA--[protein]-cysteine S-methyltransferase [Clostridia bacterium]
MKGKQPLETSLVEHVMVDTPIGRLIISAKNGSVYSIRLAREDERAIAQDGKTQPVLNIAIRELREYFAGARTTFSFPMDGEGTPFQKNVWQALLQIPFGETRTYGEIAFVVNNPKGSRAVGMACNKNPIMIAVPCHRVVGAGGKLTGYAYGTDMKQQLLALEQQEQHE